MIQRNHAHLTKDRDFMEAHADAIDKLQGQNFRADKLFMYDSLSEMIVQRLIIFPPELNPRGKVRKEVVTDGGDVDVIELSPTHEQFRALNEISMSKVEACTMQKQRSGATYVIKYPPNKSRYPDDRVDTLAMAAGYLVKLRRKDTYGDRPDRGNLKDVVNETMKRNRSDNPFGGQKPFEWGRNKKIGMERPERKNN